MLANHLSTSWRSHNKSVAIKHNETVAALHQDNQELRSKIRKFEAAATKTPRIPTVVDVDVETHIGGIDSRYYDDEPFYGNKFYIDEPGYKIQLSVYFQENYVSLYNTFVSGYYDDDLKWPFEGSIEIELVNQYDGDNYQKVIHYDKDSPIRVRNLRNCGFSNEYGFSEFISTDEFWAKYVHRDHAVIKTRTVKYFP